jgi:hypothetical protein
LNVVSLHRAAFKLQQPDAFVQTPIAPRTRLVIKKIDVWPATLLLNILRRARSVYYAAAAGGDGLVQH